MPTNAKSLGEVKIAKPCHRDWEQMVGGNRSRFCGDCKLNVYNLSEMSTEEALALIKQKEGDLCVRFFERADGTVLTRDCPVGVSAHRRKMTGIGLAAASVLSLTAGAAYIGESMESEECVPLPDVAEVATAPVTAAAAPTEPQDTSWIEKRRAQVGPREHSRTAHMGRITSIQVIRTDVPKP